MEHVIDILNKQTALPMVTSVVIPVTSLCHSVVSSGSLRSCLMIDRERIISVFLPTLTRDRPMLGRFLEKVEEMAFSSMDVEYH